MEGVNAILTISKIFFLLTLQSVYNVYSTSFLSHFSNEFESSSFLNFLPFTSIMSFVFMASSVFLVAECYFNVL